MIAQLGMYDMAHMHSANDALWDAVRAQLGFGPQSLERKLDPSAVWNSPDLLLAQTCSLPYRTELHDHVQLVGTPDYGLPGCPPGYNNSVLVVHKDDDAETVEDLAYYSLSYDAPWSQSGWGAVQAHLHQAKVQFAPGLHTGSHRNSADTLALGLADFASIDALSWELLKIAEPKMTKSLRVLARTQPTPGLPLITSTTQDADALAQAFQSAIDTLPPQITEILHLKGLVDIAQSDYLALEIPPSPA